MKEKIAFLAGIGVLFAAWCHAGLWGPTKSVGSWIYCYVVNPICGAVIWVINFLSDLNFSDWF
ncbi:MAG: hypothetical protein PHC70_02165 [Patescibacteria group bacterium]|nr:hypothetical protein [Patescibacteria group bacterium]